MYILSQVVGYLRSHDIIYQRSLGTVDVSDFVAVARGTAKYQDVAAVMAYSELVHAHVPLTPPRSIACVDDVMVPKRKGGRRNARMACSLPSEWKPPFDVEVFQPATVDVEVQVRSTRHEDEYRCEPVHWVQQTSDVVCKDALTEMLSVGDVSELQVVTYRATRCPNC